MGTISPRQKNIAFMLEHNLYFDRTIAELHGNPITKDVVDALRKDISKRGITELSPFWNHLLEIKIANPKMKLSNIVVGSAPVFSFLPEPEPYCQLIGVYPETSEADVLRALKHIRNIFPKFDKTQSVNDKLYDIIFTKLKDGQSVGQIFTFIDEKTGYKVARNNIQAIVDTMKIGL